MLHQSQLVSLLQQLAFCSVLCAVLLARHTTAAGNLGLGSRCGNDSNDDACREGLVCAPATPESSDHVCKESNRSSCVTERCPRVWCHPPLQYVPEGECCPICPPLPSLSIPTLATPGCTENGVPHQEGETWERDACTTCTCEAGLPLCRSIQCALPEDCTHFVMKGGECCPTCASVPIPIAITQCEVDGQTYQEGDSWKTDPCTTCFCHSGEVVCASLSCYVECENPVYSPDTCCPVCPDDAAEPETATSLPVPIATTVPSIPPPTAVFVSPPTHCEDGDQVYENGASWNPNGDVCISCMCEDGLNICIATGCLAACSQEEQVFLPGVCCPLCPGDEGYPTSTPSSTTLSSTTPTPPPTASETATPPPSISSELPSVVSTTSCKDESGVEHSHEESWCPKQQLKATCHSGTISYTDIHCPAPTCSNPTWTSGSCDCPVCPDVAHVALSVVLDMEYSQYLKEQEQVEQELLAALDDFGLEVVEIHAESYDLKQTQVIISLAPLGENNKIETFEADLNALLQELKYPTVASLKIGHHNEEPKSIDSGSKPLVQASTSNSSRGPDMTAIIVAVSLTAVVSLVCLLVILLVVTRVRKLRAIPKTTISV